MNLEKLYAQAGREIKAAISAIDPMNFNAEKGEIIHKKTRRLVLALDLAAKRWTETELTKAYSLGTRRARVALEILGRKPRRRPMAKDMALRESALETLIEANASIRRTVDEILEAALVGAQTTRSARIQEFDRSKALKRFAEMGETAVIEEVSRGELGKKIMDYLLDQITDEGFIEINGKFWNLRKYAKLVARTEMAKAAVEAKLDTCRQYDNDLVQVSNEPAQCDDCKEIVGNVYSLSGNDPDYPLLPMEVPVHPNCRHDLNPTSREAIYAREIFG